MWELELYFYPSAGGLRKKEKKVLVVLSSLGSKSPWIRDADGQRCKETHGRLVAACSGCCKHRRLPALIPVTLLSLRRLSLVESLHAGKKKTLRLQIFMYLVLRMISYWREHARLLPRTGKQAVERVRTCHTRGRKCKCIPRVSLPAHPREARILVTRRTSCLVQVHTIIIIIAYLSYWILVYTTCTWCNKSTHSSTEPAVAGIH